MSDIQSGVWLGLELGLRLVYMNQWKHLIKIKIKVKGKVGLGLLV